MIPVDGSATAHGFGLGVALYSGATVIGHNGDLRGFVSELTHLPSLEAHITCWSTRRASTASSSRARLAQALIDPAATANRRQAAED